MSSPKIISETIKIPLSDQTEYQCVFEFFTPYGFLKSKKAFVVMDNQTISSNGYQLNIQLKPSSVAVLINDSFQKTVKLDPRHHRNIIAYFSEPVNLIDKQNKADEYGFN